AGGRQPARHRRGAPRRRALGGRADPPAADQPARGVPPSAAAQAGRASGGRGGRGAADVPAARRGGPGGGRPHPGGGGGGGGRGRAGGGRVSEPLGIVFDVDAEPDHGFGVWTQRASMWWPPAHTAANRKGTRLVFEPKPGGRVFERDPDGNEVDWGTVVVWQPPGRLVYRWHLFADATDATEVEVHFAAHGDGTTRGELE